MSAPHPGGHTLAIHGRLMADRLPDYLGAVAALAALSGLVLLGAPLVGLDVRPWAPASPVTTSVLGGLLLGVAPGLGLAARHQLWEEVRLTAVPAGVVVVGLFAVSVGHVGDLALDGRGGVLAQLSSLCWLLLLGALAAATVAVLAQQAREPRVDLPTLSPMPAWARPPVGLLGAALVVAGSGLLALPAFWGRHAPWELSSVDARALGVWSLAVGVGVLASLAFDDLARAVPALVALACAGLGALLGLVAQADGVAWISGGGLAVVALVGGSVATAAMGQVLGSRVRTVAG